MSKTTTTINIPGGILITVASEVPDPPSPWVTTGDLQSALGPLQQRLDDMETATDAVVREAGETRDAVNAAVGTIDTAVNTINDSAIAMAGAIGLLPALKAQIDVAVAAAQGNNPALLEAANMMNATQTALGTASQKLVAGATGLAEAAAALGQAVAQATPAPVDIPIEPTGETPTTPAG